MMLNILGDFFGMMLLIKPLFYKPKSFNFISVFFIASKAALVSFFFF
jgi:hypothetical protein